MKNLKKLSAVFFMTVLFSVSFTSCIDNEVSPLVEEIYAAQADLLAAQAKVQDAEAAYLEAQAAHEQAMADYQAAQTAALEAETSNDILVREQNLLKLIAETSEAVAAAEARAAEAALVHQQEMARLMAEIEAAGVELATEYAYQYRYAMNAANSIWSDLIEAQEELANAQLMLVGDPGEEVSYAFYKSQLEGEVAAAEAEIAMIEDKLELFNENAEEPRAILDSLQMERVALRAELEELNQAYAAQEEVIDNLEFDNSERNEYVTELENELFIHNHIVDAKNDRLDWIEAAEANIALWETALADYPAAVAALEADVAAAAQAVADAEAALGMVDGAGNDVTFDDYFMVDADGDPIAAGGATYDDPTTLQEEYVNARIENLEAQAAYTAYAAEYADLVASYNEAATALADAQADYDAADYEGDLEAAQAALVVEQADFDADMQAYEDAKATFEADPNGSDVEDGAELAVTDLGEVGLQDGPANTTTYMRVATWTETSVGSGEYVPATFYPTKYNEADLATEVADLIAMDGDPYPDGEAGAEYNIENDGDVVVWEQNGTSVDGGGNATVLPTNGTYLTGAEAQDAISVVGNPDINTAYFVEVELDDEVVTNLYAFNVATNTLGLDDFSDRPYTMADLTTADADAGYDTTPNAEGENVLPVDGDWMLTAYAELWNAKRLVAEEQEDLDLGEQALIDAQAEFDAQKDLFENGAENLATLEAEAAAAAAAEADAQDAVDAAWVELGADLAEGEAGDALIADPDTLNEELFNAEVALADFMVCDEACIEANIATAEANIEEWENDIEVMQASIDAQYAIVSGLLAQLTELGVEYTFEVEEDGTGTFEVTNDTVVGDSYADIRAELLAEYQKLWEMEQAIDRVENEQEMINDLISAWNDSYGTFVNTTIPNLEDDLAEAKEDLAQAEAALALAVNAETAAEANIEYYQALVDTLEQRYQNALAIAAEYKALMEAALAS